MVPIAFRIYWPQKWWPDRLGRYVALRRRVNRIAFRTPQPGRASKYGLANVYGYADPCGQRSLTKFKPICQLPLLMTRPDITNNCSRYSPSKAKCKRSFSSNKLPTTFVGNRDFQRNTNVCKRFLAGRGNSCQHKMKRQFGPHNKIEHKPKRQIWAPCKYF